MKKNAFKGQARTLTEPPKEKPVPKIMEIISNKEEEVPEPIVLPGPGNRQVKVIPRSLGAPGKPAPEVPESDYSIKSSDIKGMKSGFGEPKTFASVRKEVKIPSRIAKIKFDIRTKEAAYFVEAQFATSETISVVYEFLEIEILGGCKSFEIVRPFPRSVIPNEEKPLAALQLHGSQMLQVFVQGDCIIKV